MDDKVIAPIAFIEPPEASPTSPEAWPPFADTADDLKELKKAVEDAAAISGALWLSYLFALFYFAIAAGAVTHADLLLERPVKLPFLNIDLPLISFFFLSPILFVLVHTYTLTHFVMLTKKAKRFDAELRRQIQEDQQNVAGVRKAALVRDAIRLQLPGNIFVQFLAGPEQIRERGFQFLLWQIAWTTLVVGPILLLLLLELQFLPYHNLLITWSQRIAVITDLLIIWWLWRQIIAGRREFHSCRSWISWVSLCTGVGLSCAVVLFACAIAVFPGEWQEHLPSLGAFDGGRKSKTSLHNLIFDQPVDSVTRRRTSYLSATLVVPGLNIYDELKIDDPTKVDWRKFVFLARGRDLKGAVFDLAILPKVDFEGAQLQGASLDGANLQGASLESANLQGASLKGAELQGASLDSARLQGDTLDGANLQGASLDSARLEGTSFRDAQLQGASFDVADLRGSSLLHARVQGASFTMADLQGASLREAQLQGASFESVRLSATDFRAANLWRASFDRVDTLDPMEANDIWVRETIWAPVAEPDEIDDNHALVRLPWSHETFAALKQEIMSAPAGTAREMALKRIARLDCQNQDTTNLASCDPAVPPPHRVTTDQAHLEQAQSKTGGDFEKALAASLQRLVCRGDSASIYILRGLTETRRLQDTGSQAPVLVNYIMGKDCPLPLNDADKAELLRIKTFASKP